MPKGKVPMGKKAPAPMKRGRGPVVGKPVKPAPKVGKKAVGKPKISRSGDTMSGYNYGTKQGPGFTGGSPYREPQGTEVSGSSIRPQLDKMSISGSTTNTRQRGGGVTVNARSRGTYRDGSGTYRFAEKNDILEKINADYAYNKGVLNEIDATAKARITRNNQKRRGGK